MSIKSSLSKTEKLKKDDFGVFLRCDYDQVSFLILNHFEAEVVRVHGGEFVVNSSDKIQYIICFLVKGDIDGLYDMYSQSYDIYMEGIDANAGQVQTFNTVFMVLVHMATKILAKTSK